MKPRIAGTPELRILARNGREAGYNRQLPTEIIETLDPEGIHVIEPLMVHEHAAGEPTEPHLRCQIYMKEQDSIQPRLAVVDFVSADVEALRLPRTVSA